jgi:hypothetical protein
MRPPRSAPTAAPGQGFWTDLRLQEVAAALEATVVATLGSIANDGLELADGADLKGHHRVDDQLSGDITAWWETSRLPVRLYLEGQAPQDPPGGTAVAALLIDPIDGSINRDLMVGDPGFALGRYAGLVVGDLDGRPLDELEIDMDRAQDFVVASSHALFDAVYAFLGDNLGACPLRQLCEKRPEPQRGQFEIDLG